MRPRIFLLGTPIFLLVACSSSRAPTLEVVDAQVVERTQDAAVVVFTLDASNPNAAELPLNEADYTLALDGRTLFRGERSPEATVRRRGAQRIELPAVIPLGENGVEPYGRHRYELRGTIVYLKPGPFAEVLYDSGVSRPSVSFSETGTIDFDDAP